MSLLDLLGLGGAPGMAQGAQAIQGQASVPPPSANPTAASAAPPAQTNAAPPMPPASTPQDVVVTGKRPTAPPPGAGYNNMDEVNALHGLQQQYAKVGPPPDQGGTGLVGMIPDAMPGAGTLRNMLGTLGDAFLVQAGHQPAYAQRQQREQIANAAAGFDTDPGAASARIAATAAPGSMQDAQTMYQAAQNNDLKKATLQNTQAYRDSIMADREQNHQATQAIAQGKADDRTRTYIGGLMQAAVSSGKPQQYAAARAQALKLGAKVSDFNPDTEAPEDMNSYANGYGMSAGQVARNTTANSSISERATANNNNVAARYAGIQAGVQNNNARVGATYAGQAAAGQRQDKALAAKGAGGGAMLPPGLRPPGGGQAPAAQPQQPGGQFHEGGVYTDAHGNRARYVNGHFVNP